MKLLKKLTMMLLAIGMMASVVACGGAGEGAESSTETSQTSEVKEVGQNLTETEFQAAVQELYAQKINKTRKPSAIIRPYNQGD